MSQSPTMLIWMRSHLGTTFIWTIRYSCSKFLVVHITNIHTKSLYKYFWDFTSPRARERARNLCKMMICRFWAEFGLGRLDTFRGDIARTWPQCTHIKSPRSPPSDNHTMSHDMWQLSFWGGE